jgi:hypothetical protein
VRVLPISGPGTRAHQVEMAAAGVLLPS